MKQDRNLQLKELTDDLGLILQDRKENAIAFTTDAEKYKLLPFLQELALTQKDKKIAIATYAPVSLQNGIENIVLRADDTDIEQVKVKFSMFDMVLVELPNAIKKHNYLLLSKFVKLAVIVAKEFDSKDSNVVRVKQNLQEQGMDVLGIVYQK